jgi:hypothetical protein
MTNQCESPTCKGALNFLVHNPMEVNPIVVGVCGNHLAWAVRHFGDPGITVTITNVTGEDIESYRSRIAPFDLDSNTAIG